MPSYHEITDQIRSFVQATDQTRSPAMEALAAAYAEACGETSRRLSRCQWLLQQGLRSEAIQLAESEPKLLDAVAALDFPERSDWDELVDIYGLAAAPRIQTGGAEFLNEAYALEDPLQDLLKSHRRLALSRAPIKDRIAVMRKLAAQDPNNLIWTEDLRVFEKTRFQQIQLESAEAARHRDSNALGRLLAELDNQTWVATPPRELVQGLRKVDAKFRGEQNRAILADLEARLQGAFAASDPIRGRQARDQWLALVEAMKVPPDDPVRHRVEPALRWLEEEDSRDEADHQHESAIRTLSEALDDVRRIAPRTLEHLGNAVLRHHRGMSEDLRTRYLDRLAREREAVSRRTKLIISATAAAAVLLLTLIGLAVRRQTRAADADRAALAISDMLELGKLEEAGEFVKKLQSVDAGLFEHPPMVEARERLEAAQEKEVKRQLEFAAELQRAETAPIFPLVPRELDRARVLARLATEKEAVERLGQRRQAALQEERQRRDAEIDAKLQSITGQVARMKDDLGLHPTDDKVQAKVERTLTELRSEFAGLGPGLLIASESLQGLAREVEKRLEGLQSSIDVERRQRRIEREMNQLLRGSPRDGLVPFADYANLLHQYASTQPNSPRSQAVEQAIRELPAWQSVAKWNELVEAWRKEPAGWSLRKVQARQEACTRFLALHPQYPDAVKVNEYWTHLEAILKRASGPDSVRQRLRQLFSDILIGSIWMVEVKEFRSLPKRYYLREKPREGSNLVHFITGFDGKERVEAIIRENIDYSDWSPQSKVADKFKVVLSQDSAVENWDKVMMDLAAAIKDDAKMDPLLKIALLRKVVEAAGQGSVPLRQSLSTVRSMLEQADVDVTAPWMDPESREADRLRPAGEGLIKSLPEFDAVRRQAKERLDKIENLSAGLARTVGWLAKTPDGWRVKTDAVLPESGELWVIVPREKNTSVWKRLGRIVKSVPGVTAVDGEVLLEGRPVFVMPGPVDQA